MNFGILFNPAGGVRYHLRALQYSKSLWQPFRWAIGEFLLRFQPNATTLLVVGPSAGYCLQPFLFERFERLVCLEPEPIARYFFSRRIKQATLERTPKIEFITEDHLVKHPERLPKLAAGLGDCAVLFSNVLGQLRGLLEIDELEHPKLLHVRNAIREVTANHAFVSFHDRVSGRIRPSFVPPFRSSHRLSDDEVATELYKHTLIGDQAEAVTLLDHFTSELFNAELPHEYFTWQLEPGSYHLIEGVMST
jgi:hypothetical protein